MSIYRDHSGLWERLRTRRRELVKAYGRSLLRKQARFLYRQSLIGDQPVLDKSIFPWIADLESGWPAIRDELDDVLQMRDELPSFHSISPDQRRISQGDSWKSFGFYVLGDRFEPNCKRCPETTALLEQVPNLRNAWFSILSPHYRIPPHRGPTNGIVRVHLGLKVPASTATSCAGKRANASCSTTITSTKSTTIRMRSGPFCSSMSIARCGRRGIC
jgi:beta-hydroxylase